MRRVAGIGAADAERRMRGEDMARIEKSDSETNNKTGE